MEVHLLHSMHFSVSFTFEYVASIVFWAFTPLHHPRLQRLLPSWFLFVFFARVFEYACSFFSVFFCCGLAIALSFILVVAMLLFCLFHVCHYDGSSYII